ncbi:DUF2000 domain-containing protein [Rhodobacterales bacterium]|nr:DUF2000 domain-containing protein [Rhodobacterales bacterium]
MSIKPAIIVADDLPVGLKANFAAVLGMSLGKMRPDLVGPDTQTGDDITLPGITSVAIPILAAPAEDLPRLFGEAGDLPLRLAYMQAAFEARNYADYTDRISGAALADHAPKAILLGGPRKAVDRICGRLPLVR